MSADEQDCAKVQPAQHPFAHLIPTRAMTAEEQAAITRREDARRKGRGRKDWFLRCPMKTSVPEPPK